MHAWSSSSQAACQGGGRRALKGRSYEHGSHFEGACHLAKLEVTYATCLWDFHSLTRGLDGCSSSTATFTPLNVSVRRGE